jgi:hypothetical protein
MTVRTARHWLGIYFLLVTVLVGGFLLVFSGSVLLPLTGDEAKSSFQVIVPVLVGQVAIVFRWLSTADPDVLEDNKVSPVPGWAIILPPCLALFCFIVGVVALCLSNRPESGLSVGPPTFQAIVTFTVTILNASTVLLVGRLFHVSGRDSRRRSRQGKTTN